MNAAGRFSYIVDTRPERIVVVVVVVIVGIRVINISYCHTLVSLDITLLF